MEVWKDIPGYENKYQVSNMGNIKSLFYHSTFKPALLRQEINKGYCRVSLSRNQIVKRFLVHQLVCLSFLPNLENKKFVNHINGIKTDNRLENLEWCTSSENERHSYTTLKKVNPIRKLSESDVAFIKANAVKGNNKLGGRRKSGNIKQLAQQFNVCVHTIHNVVNGLYYVQAS